MNYMNIVNMIFGIFIILLYIYLSPRLRRIFKNTSLIFLSKTLKLVLLFSYTLYKIKLMFINSNSVVISKTCSEITYYRGITQYKLRYPRNITGPRKIRKIITSSGTDITDIIFKYMGPDKDFHGIKTTPKLLGYQENIIVEYINKVVEYKPDEHIEVS